MLVGVCGAEIFGLDQSEYGLNVAGLSLVVHILITPPAMVRRSVTTTKLTSVICFICGVSYLSGYGFS